MKQRRRIYYSAAQRSEIWDRLQAGEPCSISLAGLGGLDFSSLIWFKKVEGMHHPRN